MSQEHQPFVHLHVHSEFSLLDGLSRVKHLAARAKELNMPALALTDHGVMYGAIQFYRTCRQAGVKPILGIESYVATRGMRDKDAQLDKERFHLLLLAENQTGYQNLLKIASAAQLEGFYYRPRIDHDYLAAHAEGLIATTGCMAAEIPRAIAAGNMDKAHRLMDWYLDVFGRDRFFVELQEHNIPELTEVNKALLQMAGRYNLRFLATNDVHYTQASEAGPHDVLLCIQTSKPMNARDRLRMSDKSYYLKSHAEMAKLFGHVPGALDNSLLIAEMCQVNPEPEGYHLPVFEVPAGFHAESYLRHLCEKGLVRRYGDERAAHDVALRQRLEHELGLIHQMGFDTYFLVVWDLCEFARQSDIWWNVRGSGAGSVVAYTLGITGIDPLANGLIFERFLNPGRVSMPDIDLDYPDDRRQEMIEYTVRKYGSDKVAQIITFGTMGARAAIRDVGRVLEVPLAEVDAVARLIPAIPGKPATIENVLDPDHEFYSADLARLVKEDESVRGLIETAKNLEGVARHASTHAAGVIIADRPLVEYTPLHRPTSGDGEEGMGVVTQWDMEILESLGLLKVDFLGLSTLTIMRKAAELIEQRYGVRYTMENIPYDANHVGPDPSKNPQALFDLLGRGDVLGVFQVEGAGMKRLMMEMRPQRFDHIVAAISLYRPGPMENIPEYIARMHGKKPIQYHHPALEPILGDTYGICVSGDSLILNARTGQRGRLDEVKDWTEFYIQGIDDQWRPAVGRVTHWIDSGYQPVYQIRLRNGAQIKVTADHRLLTEEGWRPASDLQIGDYVATPPALLGPAEAETLTEDRRRLRILAYLIADGSLASMASVDFVSKDPLLLGEYQRCLATFENLQSSHLLQIRDVSRIRVAKDKDSQEHYHAPNSLLAWLRELKLKHPSGHNPGGLRSHEKFVPPFVFQLHDKDIAFFLASLWDCDGHMGHKLCHYKTVSRRLADDVQTLLLRLGIRSTIYAAQYTNPGGNGSGPQTRHSYQVTVYGTSRLAELLQPFMVSAKREAICQSYDSTTIARLPFIAEVDTATSLSRRALMAQYGIDRQHFYTKRRRLERISTQVVAPLAAVLNLPITRQRLNLAWEEIIAIEPAGMEHVYDLTVEGLHNFVANNVLVHNCVYQEQIIQIASQLAGYEPGEADMIRKAVAKKKKDLMEKHRLQFTEGAMARGFSREVCEAIWGDIEFFARYGFNRAHASDYAVITCQTAFLKAHYPVEYMTALLSVERNNTEKVAQYLADARRMGINVAPPDVNLAELDFTIEGDARQATIRYGLGAIKNAGTTAIELILQERSANGRFTSLTDLCDRVDLRRVGKRALESMIKVGVFDRWGSRPQLLDGLDRILSHSGGAREAASAGQMNLFGFLGVPQTMRVELLRPPAAVPPIDPKELLQWEKELIGVYISDHPVSRALESLQSLVTAGTADLDETMNGKNVALAGVITHVRTHSTKKGDQMAFATLEDLQGSVDLVFFPRPWKEHKEKVRLDQVLLVRGKVQLGAGNNGNKEGTTILVDNVQTNATIASAADEAPPETPFVPAVNGQRNGVARPPLMKDEGRPVNDGNPPNSDEDRGAAVEGLTTEQPAAKRKSKIQNPKSNIPLPPPNFDDDWLATATRPPELDFDLADDGLPPPLKPNHNLVRDKKPGYGTAVEPAAPPPPLSLVGRRAGGEGEPDPSKIQNPKSKIVTIEVDAIGEWKETFRQSLHIALTYEGADRLSLRLPRFGLVMDFPNYPTRFCPELVSQLQALPGVLRVYCP